MTVAERNRGSCETCAFTVLNKTTHEPSMTSYEKQSLTLLGAVSMGTGVMIGAGIFALTGQIAELAGPLFPVAFVLAAVISAFGSYSYVKMSQAYPSAGGIAMFLQKAYGKGLITAFCALLLYFSMVWSSPSSSI
jgi:amino acid transporter